MADFLLYVVDRHIRDRSEEITEQQIGVLVFGRTEGYDSNEDNIVRSYARNLRKRIEDYFAGEGSDETIRVDIPRGGYIPIFSTAPTKSAATPSEPDDETGTIDDLSADGAEVAPAAKEAQEEIRLPQQHQTKRSDDATAGTWFLTAKEVLRGRPALTALCVSLSIGLLAVLVPLLRRMPEYAHAHADQALSHALWAHMFTNERDTFIVPSDDGLVIMQGVTERPVPLANYLDGSYRTKLRTDQVPGTPELLKLGRRRYTSVVDLDFVAHLAQLNEVVPARMMIRYARDLRIQDLRTGNAILIGSIEANPWIELFQPQMAFSFSIHPDSDIPSGIVNSHPRAGEAAIYGTPQSDHTYGLIAYIPNLNSTGHVLIVGGLNTAGTEAATTFLLTPSLMKPTLQRAKAANGGLQPFELLVGAGNVATNASTPQLVVERIGLP